MSFGEAFVQAMAKAMHHHHQSCSLSQTITGSLPSCRSSAEAAVKILYPYTKGREGELPCKNYAELAWLADNECIDYSLSLGPLSIANQHIQSHTIRTLYWFYRRNSEPASGGSVKEIHRCLHAWL